MAVGPARLWAHLIAGADADGDCLICVADRRKSRRFTDQDGNEGDITEVIAAEVQFLDGLGDSRPDLPADDYHHIASDDLDLPFELAGGHAAWRPYHRGTSEAARNLVLPRRFPQDRVSVTQPALR
jgi:hypothetical protein